MAVSILITADDDTPALVLVSTQQHWIAAGDDLELTLAAGETLSVEAIKPRPEE